MFFVFVLLLITCTGSLSSHNDECLALYQFRQTVIHQHHSSLVAPFDSWKITNNASHNYNGRSRSSCCLWDGVECNNKGHVIGLDLSESFLHGTISSNSTLFSLVHLQRLNLASNDFAESQIPSEIGRLRRLKALNLSGSGFTGQIPYEVGELIRLSLLDLSWNPLKLQSPSFEKLVQNLTQLEEFHLSEVDISSSVPRFLANFSSLRSISLVRCGLQNEFPPSVFHLPKLKFLRLSVNTNLTGSFPEFRNNSLLEELTLYSTGFFGVVPESISNLHRLRYLDLSLCSFSGRIPSSLTNLTRLVALGLGHNDLTSNVIPSLDGLTQLKILQLSGNEFENGCFPNWLGKLTQLNQLYLFGMSLRCEIPALFVNLTNLNILDIGINFLRGPIPFWFYNLTQLTLLDLGGNQLQGPISSSFSNFRSLQDLSLHNNYFSGRVDLDTFLGLNKLESLVIGYNKISVIATNNYTNGTLPQLKSIDLSSCNLKEFPAFLRFQHQIELLSFERNKIHGLIPVWIWNNSKETLRFLDLSDNNITGKISPVVCELKVLGMLDLSLNNMSGIVPPCLGSLGNSLMALDLKRNNFQGTMMNAFMPGNLLKKIDLSENQFTGHVSESLVNCTNLEFLSLGDNSFVGLFPSWLGTLPELQVLILQSNKFYGAVQGLSTVSSQFPKLRIIDLSNNGFSGPLPEKYFQTWNAMKSHYVDKSFPMTSTMHFGTFYIQSPYRLTLTIKGHKTDYKKILNIFVAMDLSCNNFQGQIPQSFQDLQGLESLNLSNNHFTGHGLMFLGTIHNLESLDLSHNELSGEIPQQLLQLGFLAIFNVSFNHLHGRIPQGKQFNTFENNSYKGNPELCGTPLSKECQDAKVSTPQPTNNESDSLLPSETIDWIVILSGFGSGLVVGIVIGNLVYAKHSDWFIERFGMKINKWVRPLSNKRKN